MSRAIWIFIFSFITNYTVIIAGVLPINETSPTTTVTNASYLTSPSLSPLEPVLQYITDLSLASQSTTADSVQIIKEESPVLIDKANPDSNGTICDHNIELEANEYPTTDFNVTEIEDVQRDNATEIIVDKFKYLNNTRNSNGTHTSSKQEQILSKIETALSKSKASKISLAVPQISTPHMVPIFKPRYHTPPKDKIESSIKPSNLNPKPNIETLNSIPKVSKSEASNIGINSNNFVITGAVLRPFFNLPSENTPKHVENLGTNVRPATKLDFGTVNVGPTVTTDKRLTNIPCEKNSLTKVINKIDTSLPITNLLQKNAEAAMKFRSVNAVPSKAADTREKICNTVTLLKNVNGPESINLGSLAEIPNVNEKSKQNGANAENQVVNRKNAEVVLLKPETVTLEELYGDFVKKLTMTVLVPFHVSKLSI